MNKKIMNSYHLLLVALFSLILNFSTYGIEINEGGSLDPDMDFTHRPIRESLNINVYVNNTLQETSNITLKAGDILKLTFLNPRAESLYQIDLFSEKVKSKMAYLEGEEVSIEKEITDKDYASQFITYPRIIKQFIYPNEENGKQILEEANIFFIHRKFKIQSDSTGKTFTLMSRPKIEIIKNSRVLSLGETVEVGDLLTIKATYADPFGRSINYLVFQKIAKEIYLKESYTYKRQKIYLTDEIQGNEITTQYLVTHSDAIQSEITFTVLVKNDDGVLEHNNADNFASMSVNVKRDHVVPYISKIDVIPTPGHENEPKKTTTKKTEQTQNSKTRSLLNGETLILKINESVALHPNINFPKHNMFNNVTKELYIFDTEIMNIIASEPRNDISTIRFLSGQEAYAGFINQDLIHLNFSISDVLKLDPGHEIFNNGITVSLTTNDNDPFLTMFDLIFCDHLFSFTLKLELDDHDRINIDQNSSRNSTRIPIQENSQSLRKIFTDYQFDLNQIFNNEELFFEFNELYNPCKKNTHRSQETLYLNEKKHRDQLIEDYLEAKKSGDSNTLLRPANLFHTLYPSSFNALTPQDLPSSFQSCGTNERNDSSNSCSFYLAKNVTGAVLLFKVYQESNAHLPDIAIKISYCDQESYNIGSIKLRSRNLFNLSDTRHREIQNAFSLSITNLFVDIKKDGEPSFLDLGNFF